jgi:hypothetical protein
MKAAQRIIASFAIFFASILASRADDPCEGLDAKATQLLMRNTISSSTEVWDGDEGALRTIKPFQHASGKGMLVKWNFGAAGRLECAFLAYRAGSEQYHPFPAPNLHTDIKDIDRDGIDELILLDGLPWGMDCSSVMATLPYRLKIAHLDASSGALVDVTRDYSGYVGDFLKTLKGSYEDYAATKGVQQTTECEHAWVGLLKDTYETAWFRLIMAASGISIVTFFMGVSKSPRWRWAARAVGAIVLLVSIGTLFYSLGTVGWHCIGFCEAWSALQIITGFKVHSASLDVVSLVLTAYGACRILWRAI